MSRAWCSLLLLVLVAVSGCSAGAPTAAPAGPVAPVAVDEQPQDVPSSVDGPPPLPDTPCLPETPVQADLIGQYGYACLVTPFRWKVTNTSLTVIQLEPGSTTDGVRFADVTIPSGAASQDNVAALVDRYRSPRSDTYWLQPQDTVEVSWASGPGFLRYHADPAESAARTLVSEGIESLTSYGRHASPADVVDCVDGVSNAVRDTSQLSEETWNKILTNGLTVSGCVGVVDDVTDADLAERLRRVARQVWVQVKALVRNPDAVIRYASR